jgi:NitT/TauT family transport system ATP-binding protein
VVRVIENSSAQREMRTVGLHKVFNDLIVLDDINLEVARGHIHTLLGPSGCGKTTLLRVLAGFEEPDAGQVFHRDAPVSAPDTRRGFMFQEGVCFPWRTVRRNVLFGPEMRGVPRSEAEEIAQRFITLVGLEGFEHYWPAQLSGGMRQRMVLASVLANEAEVLLMDEPFGALDAQTRELMQRELLRIWSATQKTIVFVTHSIREALLISNRVTLLRRRPGRIKETIDVDAALGKMSLERSPSDQTWVQMEARLHQELMGLGLGE